ncbi:P-type ATPase, putative [Perkinsus marinus ATCC 50983]|uniref:P-type ATPase, putative n=1 Tax=Perkinsus marinus (strain ATCC 50983 / TXsc) TaxID=423536 RepID=C5LHB3_PERM5|nr:P-type ATPase, putative [Perkinsus marinus ATCC 50983]EER03922.1 P-type ATPase, putative [Perkinsus marinus ATCC 50983]|eukprot:XP_002772106.1 P-type ATPase, putative [Perkinsus marinus ATCC 50983]
MEFGASAAVIWTCVLCCLLLVSAIFLIYRSIQVTRSVKTKYKSSGSRRLSFHSPDEVERFFIQTGYKKTIIGTIMLHAWLVLLGLAYLAIVIFSSFSYFPTLLSNWRTDWDGVVIPAIYSMVVFHVLAGVLSKFYHSLVTLFMVPEPHLSDATNVVIEEAVPPAVDSKEMIDPGMASDEDIPAFNRYVSVLWDRLRTRFRSATRKTMVEVEYDEMLRVRCYEYMCVRYVFDTDVGRFRPVGMGEWTASEMHQRLREGGMSHEEATLELEETGPNEIRVRVPGIIESLASEFSDVLYILQSIAAWTYIVFTTWNIGIIWLAMTLIAGTYRALFIVRRGQKKIATLAKLETRVQVLRSGKWVEIGSHGVVLGDLLKVEEREPLPCDGVVVEGSVIVNESMLTGEPMPIQKFSVDDIDDAEITKKNTAYAGTMCMQSTGPHDGRAILMATSVGALTTKGQLIRMVLFPQSVRFKYTDQLPIVYGMLALYAVLIIVLYLTTTNLGSWVVTVLQILSTVAQTMNPMLPVSIVMGQSVAAFRLEKHHQISCLQPGRIPVAGKISTMVFDKTGTITKDGMDFAAVVAVDPSRRTFLGKIQFEPDLPPLDERNRSVISEQVPLRMQYGLACCHTVTTLRDGTLVGNHVEVSMLTMTGWSLPAPDAESTDNIITSPKGEHKLKVLKKLDFDHHRMTSGAVVRDLSTGEVIVIIKGSYERVAALSLPDTLPHDYVEVSEGCASDNFYTLAMATKSLDSSLTDEQIISAKRDSFEFDLSMCGLLLFRNEMKPDSPAAIEALTAGNIRNVMCTGDNVLTGIAIARECGIIGKTKVGRVLIGDYDQKMDALYWVDTETNERCSDVETGVDQLAVTGSAWKYLARNPCELDCLWEDISVFARMKPEDKVNVTKYLQSRKLVVGMCGDGGNDCGALRAAHAGMALSDAEASMVSPFSSGRDGRSLFTVVDMIREGRACLATNIATYSFFIVYAFILTSSRVAGTIIANQVPAEWFWISQDVLISVIMVWTMTLSGPAGKLADYRPSGSLLGWRTILLCTFPIITFFLAEIVAFAFLWSSSNRDWYSRVNTLDLQVPPQEWAKKGDNYDMPIQVFLMLTTLSTHAYVSSYGGAFRKSVLRNWALNAMYLIVNVLLFSLLWVEPGDLSCVFRINCDTGASLETAGLPIIEQYSVGSVGGCFLGPQIHTYQEAAPELSSWSPLPEADCRPTGPGSEIALERYPWESPAISTLGYDGPNNVYPVSFRVVMTIILVLYIMVQHIIFGVGFSGSYWRKLLAKFRAV